MNKKPVIFSTLIAVLLCIALVITIRQKTSEEYKDAVEKINATNTQLAIERILGTPQISETDQKATAVWATTTAISIRDTAEAKVHQTPTSVP